MTESKLIKHNLTDHINKKELYYRNVIQPQECGASNKSKLIKQMHDYRTNFLPILYNIIEFKGEILELGAGTCWFGSELSRLPSTNKIYCLDMSEYFMKETAPYVMEQLGAETGKITRVIGDFNKLEFEDEKFDYVVCDATLHHIPIDNLRRVLDEMRRVLKSNGKLIAIRESFLSSNPLFNNFHRRKFGSHEKTYGVIENIFTIQEWKNLLKNPGFEPHYIKSYFMPYSYQADAMSYLKNLVKGLINHSFLKFPFFYFCPSYIILLEKI